MHHNKRRHVGLSARICSSSTYSSLFTLIAYANVPLVITVGATLKKAMVVNNEIKIRDVINVTLTLDHRYTDGARAAPIYQKFVQYLNDPEKSTALDEAKNNLIEVQ